MRQAIYIEAILLDSINEDLKYLHLELIFFPL